jgi:glycopeptide antibiotics resistance protein
VFDTSAMTLPWLAPGFVVSLVLGTLLSRATGAALEIRRAVAWVLLVSLGLILAATLTPQWEAFAFGTQGSGSCDFSRIGLAPLRLILAVDDTSLNILIFLPLGASIAFLPRSRRTLLLVAAAIGLPFAIEVTQLLIPLLDRACESADVVDNLTGLVGGMIIGSLLRVSAYGIRQAASLRRQPPQSDKGSQGGD